MSITPPQQQQQTDWREYLPEPNKQRMKELIERRTHQFRPDDELDDPNPKVEIGLSILGYAAAVLQIFLLLPWYMTDWTDRKVVAVYKSEYAIPGLVAMQFIGIPGSGVYGIYIGFTLVWVRFMPWLVCGQLGIMQGRYIRWKNSINPYGDSGDVASHVPDDRYIVPYRQSYNFGGDVDPMPTLRKDRSLLALGESRSGKTTALKSLVAQWRIDNNTAIVAHGSKGEYKEFFESLGIPIQAVIGPDSSTRWNLFNEIPQEGLTDHQRRERFLSVAETLVPVTGNDPYWDQSAQQMLADIMMVVSKETTEPHHRHILATIDDPKEVAEKLEDYGFDTSALQVMDDDGIADEWQNYATKIRQRFRYLFGEQGSFSFREYFSDPQGAVVIETPDDDVESVKNSYASMCKYTCTWAKKKSPETYLLLDEIDSVGKIPNLGVTASEANKNDIQLLVGIQSIGQLESVYGDDTAGLTTNLQQTIGLAPGTDRENTDVDFLQAEIGERDELTRSESESHNPGQAASGWAGMIGAMMGSQTSSVSEERRSPIQPSEMKSWTEGEGIVSNMSGWYHIQWSHPDVIPELHDRRGSVEIEIDGSQGKQTWDADGARAEQQSWDDQETEIETETHVNVGNTDE